MTRPVVRLVVRVELRAVGGGWSCARCGRVEV